MIITILAYRSSGSTYCRGCEMDRWGSDFEFGVYDEGEYPSGPQTITAAAEFVLKFLVYNDDKENGGDYDITILLDGRECHYYFTSPTATRAELTDTVAKAVMEQAKGFLAADKKAKEEAAKAEEAQEEAEKAAWTKEQARLKEIKEHEEYERLKAKFEGGKDAEEAGK